MLPKYRVTTLGCKVNQYESQQVRETLEALGLSPAAAGETPDLAVVNTCAVTVSASRKSRQAIRRISQGGRVPTVVLGCDASSSAERLMQIPGVVAVAGHDRDICAALANVIVSRLGLGQDHGPDSQPSPGAALADGAFRRKEGRGRHEARGHADGPLASDVGRSGDPATHSSISDEQAHVNDSRTADRPIRGFVGHQRAFLKVQDGCDAFCSYCIIPHLRTRLRSKPIAVAVAEARDLVRAGHCEIVITGIYLGAYGRDTAVRRRFDDGAAPLSRLVHALAAVEGLERLRLSSLEPGDVDGGLLASLQAHACCVPHLHLPLQSGSDNVLKRMNRQYDTGQFLDMVDRVKRALDRPAISTDVVVGFPGESEADFERTLAVAREVGFCKIHAFPFSARPGTAAAGWTSAFVDPPVARERMHRLAEIESQTAGAFVRSFIGHTQRVIVERSDTAAREADLPATLRHGRTDRYFEVFFDGADADPGDVVEVRIERVTPRRVHGALIRILRKSNCTKPRRGVS
jgi:threonylcarbamoyladenosine tRNA methylthiotransferase MtaB